MLQNKNVIYISYDGMTDPLGQSQVLPYVCGLSKEGYVFTLISFEKPDKYHQNKIEIERICISNKIQWIPLIYHKSPPILSTLYDIYILQKTALQLHNKNNYKIVHCRGYISALVGLKLKQKFGVKFLFDMRGLWADEKVDAGAWNLKNPVYKLIYQFFKRKEKECFLHADHTVSLTHAGKSEIQSWQYMQGRPDNITVIPCCVDTSLFNKQTVSSDAISTWKIKLNIKDNDKIVTYLGSIGTWYMLNEMLDFFKVYHENNPTARFLFITHDEHDKIRNEASKRGLEDSIIIQPAKRNEVAELASLSYFSIFFIRPTYSKISSSPTKQAELMSLGIPIVCNKGVGDTDAIVLENKAGIAIRNFSKDCYQNAIQELKNLSFDAKSVINVSHQDFSLSAGVKKYLSIYQKL